MPRSRTIRLKLAPFSPQELAHLEIGRLASVPELQSQRMLGGLTTPEMEEENERRRAEKQRRKLEIIQRHGVADFYLDPLLIQERRLDLELTQVRQEIAALRAIQAK